jgi:RNA polymerase sigma-70 factor, ECF subfamily
MKVEPPIDVAAAWHEVGERLRVYVARRVNPADADDVVQTVMLKLLERRDEIATGSVSAWLFTVTRNAVAEYYRKLPPEVDLERFGDLPDENSGDPADRTIGTLSDCLDPMLRTLSQSDADLLRRIDLGGEAQTALAAQLHVPLSTLKSRVQRARTRLRSAFEECCSIELSRDGTPIGHQPRSECSPSCHHDEKPACS